MKYKYRQKLPIEVEKQLDEYIERIKAIKWFKPSAELKKEEIEKQVSIVTKALGVEASVEYRKLVTPDDWDAALDAALDAARGAALDAAWDAARGAARGAVDVFASNIEAYKEKYPNGNFVNLIPLWEMGLYPVGVVNGRFVIYVPPTNQEFPTELV